MPHPIVEKLKDVGLRYGDKAAVALTSFLFVVCVGAALGKKSIQLTPDEVKKAAESADSNLNRSQAREDIVKTLETSGIKPTDFAKEAEDAAKNLLFADNYKSERELMIPEPGAGLIRETPALIAPTELYAYPGRGGALVYDLDENGNRKPDTEKKEAPKEERRGRRRRRAAAGMGGTMGAMGSRRPPRAVRKSQADIEKEQKAETEQKKKEMAAKLAGRDEAPDTKDEEAKKEAPPAAQQQYKEITKGLRWVAITGVLDHGKLLANYRAALKGAAAPHYARLELERQARQKDGSWSEWDKVDSDENLKVLDNLPEEDPEELAPGSVCPDNLNDPLPFLKAGLWEKVYVASVVPKEKKEVKAPPPGAGGMGGYGDMMKGGMMGSGGGMQAMMARQMGAMGGGGMGNYSQMMQRGMGSMGSAAMMRGRGGLDEGGGYPMGGGGGDTGNYWRSEEKRVMIRALDFTPQPDNNYRYRVRIVVFNPNHSHDDVAPGVDTKATELFGPWSEPTDEITMPADVSAYAMDSIPQGPKSDVKVWFQVVRFDLSDGLTIPRKFTAGPGEVIGEVSSADIPSSEGTGKKSKPVDFNTRQIVLDTSGGPQALPAGFLGGALERPALALLLRSDGSVLARSEPDDLNNEIRKDIDKNYAREIKDSNKKRESSMGAGYGGMMQMMMGGMGGAGYPGMGGGGRR
jgi:hypothetical protein